jgi:hypothetical protein
VRPKEFRYFAADRDHLHDYGDADDRAAADGRPQSCGRGFRRRLADLHDESLRGYRLEGGRGMEGLGRQAGGDEIDLPSAGELRRVRGAGQRPPRRKPVLVAAPNARAPRATH